MCLILLFIGFIIIEVVQRPQFRFLYRANVASPHGISGEMTKNQSLAIFCLQTT